MAQGREGNKGTKARRVGETQRDGAVASAESSISNDNAVR